MSKELLKLYNQAQTFVFSGAFIDWHYYNILPDRCKNYFMMVVS